jgi:glutamate-1-semialdehyde aminotransferase
MLQKQYALQMMTAGIFILPGHPGGISTAHTKTDVDDLITTSARIAKDLKVSRHD